MDEITRQYFRTIGAKGGAAGKGTKLRARLNKQAARIRWSKHREACERESAEFAKELDRHCANLNISPNKSPMKSHA